MTERTRRRRPPVPVTRRLWLVLFLLVGILGMHGLASDHASLAAAESMPAAATSGSDPTRMPDVPMAVPHGSR